MNVCGGQALVFQQRAVFMSERVLGIDHPNTITEYVRIKNHLIYTRCHLLGNRNVHIYRLFQKRNASHCVVWLVVLTACNVCKTDSE